MEQSVKFSVTGVTNVDTDADVTLTSSDADRKRPTKISVINSNPVGNNMIVWLGTKKIKDIYDYELPTYDNSGGTSTLLNTNRQLDIPLGFDLGVGEELKVSFNCGATAADLYGQYHFEQI